MAVVRWFVLVLSLAFAVAASDLAAQNRSSFSNPAEYDAYMAALNTRDPDKRATAMEVFIAWYPASVLRTDAYEQAMAAWQRRQPAGQGRRHRRQAAAGRSRQRARARQPHLRRAGARHPGRYRRRWRRWSRRRSAASRRCAKWRKPAALSDDVFARTKQQMGARVQRRAGRSRRLQAKDYDKARRHYREAVAAEPDNLQDVYQLAVAQLEGAPLDALGFWYAARAIAIARAAKSEAAAADIDRYVRSRYRIYRGSEQGWNELLARVVAGERAPPAGFVKSIPRALTPPEAALQVVDEHDPASLSFADWALVLSHRDASPANKAAADKVWKVIADKQQGGGTRLKIPVKVITATPDIIEAAITDETQAANTVDLHIAMARPLAPLPAVGAKIAIIGTLSDYQSAALPVRHDAGRARGGIAAGGRRRLRRSPAADLHARLPAGLRRCAATAAARPTAMPAAPAATPRS